jgi:NAD(P)-dependent dehydrogenase (short-subunit alcohol dehydrogenase family)
MVRGMTNFQGKTVLVTGANSGIGEVAAEMFVRAGATTFGLVRRQAALESARKKHPAVHWILGDVGKAADLQAALEQVVNQSGRLDVLVNNAGVFEPGPLEAASEQGIRTQFDINVVGLVLTTQAALPALISSKGSILNIGSAAGHKPVPGGSIYGATKAAVESLTRSWALELAGKGVRVNAVCPGPTETPVFNKLGVPVEMVPAVKAQFVAQVPLGRIAAIDEVARWILTVSDPSVTWMTGAILAIDGGMSLT